jgi:hypothetical protein
MRVVPVRPTSESRSYCYMANSNWSSHSSSTEPYETPENIRSDLATHQIKAFRETPAVALLGSRPPRQKHDSYIALVVTVRDRPSANRREHPELGRFECGRASLGEVFARTHPANSLLNLSTTEPTL